MSFTPPKEQMSHPTSDLCFFLNGQKVVLTDVQPEVTLIEFLRSKGLTGTKLGCGEGGCGACTVMVSVYDPATDSVHHRAVNACLAPLASVDWSAVTTVEGIGSVKTGLHPVQERIAKLHGSQCGFCTPGIVMALYAFLRNHPHPTAHELEEALDGNLCRCTGYRPILDAAKTFACDRGSLPEGCCGGSSAASGGCCMSKNAFQAEVSNTGGVDALGRTLFRVVTNTADKVESADFTRVWSPDSEPIFPPFLKTHPVPASLHIVGKNVTWYRPTSLRELLALKAANPAAKLIGGNSEIGIEVKFKDCKYPALIALTHVQELRRVDVVRPSGAVTSEALLTLLGATSSGADVLGSAAVALSRDDVVRSSVASGGLVIGGGVTLSQLRDMFGRVSSDSTLPKHCARPCIAGYDMLRWFASTQIRNVATLAGNVATASPISDMNPLLVAMNAYVVVATPSTGSTRFVSMMRMFKGYRKTELQPEDIIVSIFLPFTTRFEYVFAYKQARRREDDITLVGGAFRVKLSSVGALHWKVDDACVAFAGMAPITAQSPATVTALTGAVWNESIVTSVAEALRKDLALPTTVPGGMAAFRESVAASFFFKFFVAVSLQLKEDLLMDDGIADGETSFRPAAPLIAPEVVSAVVSDPRPITSGTQVFDLPLPAAIAAGLVSATAKLALDEKDTHTIASNPAPCDGSVTGPDAGGSVGKAVTHTSAMYQVSGEALYCDDIDPPADTLEGALVLSTRPNARIVSMDASAALAMDGVVAVVTAKDVPGVCVCVCGCIGVPLAGRVVVTLLDGVDRPGENHFGVVCYDEELLASEAVHHVGQVLAVVVATSRRVAQAATKLVQVTYEDSGPGIFTVEEAIHHKSFYPYTNKIVDGDVDAALGADGVQVLEGVVRNGGQEHFYLEPNACLCIPGEGLESVTVYSSTQALMKTQTTISTALGLPQHRVVVRTKRIGGGFGGKESRTVPIAAAAAIAAFKTHRPVRINVDRDVDMLISGQRHAFKSEYRVGFLPDGKLVGLDLMLYCNAGWSSDLSYAVMDRALFSCTNAYKLGAVRAVGHVCRTNIASHTAFRGFGSPQGMFVIESIIERVAQIVGKPPEDVRQLNFIREGERTHYGQVVDNVNLHRMWNEVHSLADVEARREEVSTFNAANRYKKRGISVLPVCYGINFGQPLLNQAGALVLIYTDGSVLVTHGGVEMGQGLHTKVAQIAAQTLDIPVSLVYVEETATDKVPNSSPTAASASTDLYGGAVADACQQLKARLAPIFAADPKLSWKDAVKKAYFNRVNLSAQGFRCQQFTGYDWNMDTDDNSKRGKGPFEYITGGVCCAEVEVDVLTGDHTVRRVDIVMDIGNSVNPAIDVGQVEGAFTQGMGWATIEECVWGDSVHPWVRPGNLFTRGPGTYKPPAFNDTPVDMRVSLLHNAPNPRAIYSSKAIGEPPLFLGCTVGFAVQNAVLSARRDCGAVEPFVMDIPMTAERIRMACPDGFVQRVVGTKESASSYLVLSSC